MQVLKRVTMTFLLAQSLMTTGSPSAASPVLTIAVAANFTAPAQAISQAFKAQYGQELALAFGSTGKFYAQIHHGAPFDILLAADTSTPKKLIEQELALSNSRMSYAIGTLVLWSPVATRLSDGPAPLLHHDFKHLAIADPRLAPYGLAATETLQHLGLFKDVQSRLVVAESISQSYQYVASGNAELGLIALSQVMLNGKLTAGSVWIVPQSYYTPLIQDAVILQRAADNLWASRFMQFLQSDAMQELIQSYGYRRASSTSN